MATEARLRNSTVQSNVKALKALAKRTDLLDPESAKEHLALAQLSEGRKQILAQYLERFYRFKGVAFDIDPSRSLDDFRRNFEDNRKRIAEKLQNPRICQISFKTLRHWKATAEYHKTKDILHVMRLLGHKNIKNTLVYTHLVDYGGDEFVKIASNVNRVLFHMPPSLMSPGCIFPL
jgi:integrase